MAETKCSKLGAFGVFNDALLSQTKALPPSQRFSLPEVKQLTAFAETNYMSAIKLHQLVFTDEQTVRPSHVELFLQTPAAPPPTSAAVDPDSLPPPALVPAPAEAETEAPAEAPPAPVPAPAPVDSVPEPPPLQDEALTAAIAATIEAQVAALKQNMAAEYAEQEQAVLDRIKQLEARL